MKVIFTFHAEEKLQRKDVKKFNITKSLITKSLKNRKSKKKTKYGEYAELVDLTPRHELRIIYDTIDEGLKVITFHITRKGRY